GEDHPAVAGRERAGEGESARESEGGREREKKISLSPALPLSPPPALPLSRSLSRSLPLHLTISTLCIPDETLTVPAAPGDVLPSTLSSTDTVIFLPCVDGIWR